MLLFVDTESNPLTKEPEAIQLKWGKYIEIIKNFNHLERLEALWENCDAVIMFNAPYDLGVLSSLKGKVPEYKKEAWDMEIAGFKYRVKKLNVHSNLIKPVLNKSKRYGPPVIDLLKLWSILIDDKNISLKSLIRKELGREAIPYTEENAKTRAYQEQDVVCLEELWYRFLDKVSTIPTVVGYTYNDWGRINTGASFAKNAYEERYPNLTEWKNKNEAEDKNWGLDAALEEAYNGGITCAMFHGTCDDTAWYDIHGAYAHVIQNENMDQYKLYAWENADYEEKRPLLCYCKTNKVFTKINKSLKIFGVENPAYRYIWNYDIQAMNCLFPDAHIDVLQAFYPHPLNVVEYSLPTQWSKLKEEEEKLHGKTTLREYYKLLSNSSYGITAQRTPYKCKHTNMVVAGIITSRAHLILCQMIETARSYGCDWLYSDTDSICVDLHGCDPKILEDALNERIATYQPSETIDPYSCGCEFIGTTKVLSLKRYIATKGCDLEGEAVHDKVRLHGKSIYSIDEMDMRSMLMGKEIYAPLRISQVTANTPRTLTRCLNINPKITHPHPFMFEKGIETDKTKQDFFNKWREHIDTKTTTPPNATINDEFKRDFRVFRTYKHAVNFFNGRAVEVEDIFDLEYRQWDKEDEILFGELEK